MIGFPAGFDVALLVEDYATVGASILGVVALIVCARWIMRALGGGR